MKEYKKVMYSFYFFFTFHIISLTKDVKIKISWINWINQYFNRSIFISFIKNNKIYRLTHKIYRLSLKNQENLKIFKIIDSGPNCALCKNSYIIVLHKKYFRHLLTKLHVQYKKMHSVHYKLCIFFIS